MILKMRTGVLGAPQFFRANLFPALLGRASRADVWVAHPQVSAAHARIERREDGKLWIVDLDSRNGLRKDGTLLPAFELTTGCHFSIGSLRFEVDLEAVEEEGATELHMISDPASLVLGQTQREWAWNALCFVSQAIVFGLGSYLTRPESDRAGHGAVVALVSLPWGFIWALGFSLLAKLHRGQYRFWAFYRLSSLALSLGAIWSLGADVLAFNLPGIQSPRYVSTVLLSGVVFFVLYRVARQIFSESPAAKVMKWVAGVDAAFFGFLFLIVVLSDSSLGRMDGVYSLPLIHWRLPSTQAALGQLDRTLKEVSKKRDADWKKHTAED